MQSVDDLSDVFQDDRRTSALKRESARFITMPHQERALVQIHEYLQNHDRGKLIMACGTGKTFTSLRVAEMETGERGTVLFMVPSIALLGQSLREWQDQCAKPIHAVCVCSDATVGSGVRRRRPVDYVRLSVADLPLPACTDVDSVKKHIERARGSQRTHGGNVVVFCTYQSIDVMVEVGIEFDIIICDEAHRTTGVTLVGANESSFVKIHDNGCIRGKKRVYMTATPRIYSESARHKARTRDSVVAVCSMDDRAIYGDEMYRICFGEAVSLGLLSDYKVIVLTVSENQMTPKLREEIAKRSGFGVSVCAEDHLRLIGCINALSKRALRNNETLTRTDPTIMRSAVAFCQDIETSIDTAMRFGVCSDAYYSVLSERERDKFVKIEAAHIDGAMSAKKRDELLHWLTGSQPERLSEKDGCGTLSVGPAECRVLHNVRCLSEGVDVPSLDAILFLSARNSQIDVVQSVGRVMRRATGKKFGYIIIPVVINPGIETDKAFSTDGFKDVWSVLNALRSHDDRFDAEMNKIELNRNKSERIIVTGPSFWSVSDEGVDVDSGLRRQLEEGFEKARAQVYARIAQKCGTKPYWERWAKDVARLAEQHIESIGEIVSKPGVALTEFEQYHNSLRQNINPSVSRREAIDMLAQHIVTKPVFDSLFAGNSFLENNAVARSMHRVVESLEQQRNGLSDRVDSGKLNTFYASVRDRASGIDNAAGRQKIIVDLYDTFFRSAFPKVTEKLGIVYTPVEIVDFIIQSVEDVLSKEFGKSMSDDGVFILDPFTGTGTFITRLLQSGIIKVTDLHRKYTHELFANEIVLLAYYIASINIENVLHDRLKSANAERNVDPFPGMCLTDTFQSTENHENVGWVDEVISEYADRLRGEMERQKRNTVSVIIGNPPYSIGQRSANDNAPNQDYPKLDGRVFATYVAESGANNNKAAYDAYIKAFRWACDRFQSDCGGVIAFVSNSGWLDAVGLDGFRKCLRKECASIYVYNLRGSIRGRVGEQSKKEGNNVFNIITGVAITVLVKKPNAVGKCEIFYNDVGDYLSRETKLKLIRDQRSIVGPVLTKRAVRVEPSDEGDWLSGRSTRFAQFTPLESATKFDTGARSFFCTHSMGIGTNRDACLYNFSSESLKNNVVNMVNQYNRQRTAYHMLPMLDKPRAIKWVDYSAKEIVWIDKSLSDLERNDVYEFNPDKICTAMYRPFTKMQFCYEKRFIKRTFQQTKLFPETDSDNLLICVTGAGGVRGFSSVITNTIPDLQFVGVTQCFPLYWYEKKHGNGTAAESEYTRYECVSDYILNESQKKYGQEVSKVDIFYYVYGVLHNSGYRKTFANDLRKMLPRMPLINNPEDFWAFCHAGRSLADAHVHYEVQTAPAGVLINNRPSAQASFTPDELITTRMVFRNKGRKDAIIYNQHITVSNIPLKAYKYVICGMSAVEWVMRRYAISVHKKSGIRNDPNDWGREHCEPGYILALLLSVIDISVRTVEICERLPKVDWGKTTLVE